MGAVAGMNSALAFTAAICPGQICDVALDLVVADVCNRHTQMRGATRTASANGLCSSTRSYIFGNTSASRLSRLIGPVGTGNPRGGMRDSNSPMRSACRL